MHFVLRTDSFLDISEKHIILCNADAHIYKSNRREPDALRDVTCLLTTRVLSGPQVVRHVLAVRQECASLSEFITCIITFIIPSYCQNALVLWCI